MSLGIVDIALVEINYSGGNKVLKTVSKLTIHAADKKKAVKTMNVKRRAIGFTRGVPDFEADMDHVIELGAPEVDYHELMLTREVFQIFYQEGETDASRRWQCVDVVVDDISKPFQESGETMETVKLQMLDHRSET